MFLISQQGDCFPNVHNRWTCLELVLIYLKVEGLTSQINMQIDILDGISTVKKIKYWFALSLIHWFIHPLLKTAAYHVVCLSCHLFAFLCLTFAAPLLVARTSPLNWPAIFLCFLRKRNAYFPCYRILTASDIKTILWYTLDLCFMRSDNQIHRRHFSYPYHLPFIKHV